MPLMINLLNQKRKQNRKKKQRKEREKKHQILQQYRSTWSPSTKRKKEKAEKAKLKPKDTADKETAHDKALKEVLQRFKQWKLPGFTFWHPDELKDPPDAQGVREKK